MSKSTVEKWIRETLDVNEDILDIPIKIKVSCSCKRCEYEPRQNSKEEDRHPFKNDNNIDDNPNLKNRNKNNFEDKISKPQYPSPMKQETPMGNCNSKLRDSTETYYSDISSDNVTHNSDTNLRHSSTSVGNNEVIDNVRTKDSSERSKRDSTVLDEVRFEKQGNVIKNKEHQSKVDNEVDKTWTLENSSMIARKNEEIENVRTTDRTERSRHDSTVLNEERVEKQGNITKNNKPPSKIANEVDTPMNLENNHFTISTEDVKKDKGSTVEVNTDCESSIANKSHYARTCCRYCSCYRARCCNCYKPCTIPSDNTNNEDKVIAESKVNPEVSSNNESVNNGQCARTCSCNWSRNCNFCNHCYCCMCWGPQYNNFNSSLQSLSSSDSGRDDTRKRRKIDKERYYNGDKERIHNEKIDRRGEMYNENSRQFDENIDSTRPFANKRRKIDKDDNYLDVKGVGDEKIYKHGGISNESVGGNDGDIYKQGTGTCGYKEPTEPQNAASTTKESATIPRDVTCRVCRGDYHYDSKYNNEKDYGQSIKTCRPDDITTDVTNGQRNGTCRAQCRTNSTKATQTNFDGSENDSIDPNEKWTQTSNCKSDPFSGSNFSTEISEFHTNEGSWSECDEGNYKHAYRNKYERFIPKTQNKRCIAKSPVIEPKREAYLCKAPVTDKYEQYHQNAYLNYYVRLFRMEKFKGLPAPHVARYAGAQWRKHMSEREKRPYYEMRKYATPSPRMRLMRRKRRK